MAALRRDYTGQKFHYLTALSFLHGNGQGKGATWLFKCDCGRNKELPACQVAKGRVKTCGSRECPHLQSLQPSVKIYTQEEKAQHFWNGVWHSYRHGALSRGLEFHLTREEVRSIAEQPCYYCQEPPRLRKYQNNKVQHCSGIDRVDNRQGYHIDNCVPCCTWCNSTKSAMPVKQFIDRIKRIYETQLQRSQVWQPDSIA